MTLDSVVLTKQTMQPQRTSLRIDASERAGTQDKAAATKLQLIKARTETDDRSQTSACEGTYATLVCLCVPDMMKVVLDGEEGIQVIKGVKVRWLM